MSGLKVPSALDVVRIIKPDLEGTIAGLKRYYEVLPAWGYGPARAMAMPAFSGELTLEAALLGCQKRGNPLGRASNQEAAKFIWLAGKGRSVKCFPLAQRQFAIRRDLSFLVDPLFFFVENKIIKIFWLQPRRRFNPTIEGLGTLAVILRMTYSDDFDEFDVELLDLSMPEGERGRVSRTFDFGSLSLLSEHEVRAALGRFAQAYDYVSAMGVARPERRPRPQKDSQPGLFE